MGSRRSKKYWSYVAGARGRNWVRAFEKTKGGVLFLEWYETSQFGERPKRKRASLGHRDRGKAKGAADELAAAFLTGDVRKAATRATDGGITIHQLIDRYLAIETPYKSLSKQGHDRRTARMLKSFFPRPRKADSLNLGDWNGFIRARRECRIGPPTTLRRAAVAKQNGDPLPTVGDRQIEYDLRFLWAVLNWATRSGDDEGVVLLARHPLKECVHTRHWPKAKNPERPTLDNIQYQKVREVAPSVDWRFEVALVLGHETGHRIGSIRRLRWGDLEAREGWIRWREDADKVGWEHWTPLTEEARDAVEVAATHRREADQPSSWVLPSPSDTSRPCSRNIMRDWWNAAQQRAELGSARRLGWHSLRRKFANDLRHVPLKDLASLGGWKDTQTLLKCYLTEDEDAMVEALRSRGGRHVRSVGRHEEGPADPSG